MGVESAADVGRGELVGRFVVDVGSSGVSVCVWRKGGKGRRGGGKKGGEGGKKGGEGGKKGGEGGEEGRGDERKEEEKDGRGSEGGRRETGERRVRKGASKC
jgi:hypothetical protein